MCLVATFFDFCNQLKNLNGESALLNEIHNFYKTSYSVVATGLYIENRMNFNLLPWDEPGEPNKNFLRKIEEKRNLEYRKVDKDFSIFPELEESKSLSHLMVVPLYDHDNYIGFLFFYGKKDFARKKWYIPMVKLLADYLSSIFSKKLLFHKMEQRVAELLTLQTVSGFVNSTLDFEKLLDVTLDALVGLFGLRTCSLTVFTGRLFNDFQGEKQKALLATVDYSQEIEIDLKRGIYGELNDKKLTLAACTDWRKEFSTIMPNTELEPGDKVQYIIVPILKDDELLGSINIFDPTTEHLDSIQSKFLESFANQFSIALQNAHLYRMQEEMANKDGLTNLYNHAYFQSRLSLLLKDGSYHPLSLILMDIDDFKQVNDQYGHLAGDSVLKKLSGILKQNTRDTDLVARYGGEEFALLFPKTDIDVAEKLAERLRRLIANKNIDIKKGASINITVSMGLAEYNKSWTKRKFVDEVDKALYKAKDYGKNRVVVA